MISNCQNFGETHYVCFNYEECFTRPGPNNSVVFCVDNQAKQELGNVKVFNLSKYIHPENCTYVFGNDTGMKMAAELQKLDKKYIWECLTIDTSDNPVFWTDQAMAIILYDRWLKK